MTYNTTTDRDLAAIRGQLAEIIVLLKVQLGALTELQQQQTPQTTKRKTK